MGGTSLDEANKIVERFGELAKLLISRRTLLESYLFPVKTYISVGLYNLYETAYDNFIELSRHSTPEKLGRAGQNLCSKINQKTHFSIMLGYLIGREQRIIDGELSEPDALSEDREKLLFLLDFWERMVSTYRRGNGLFVSDTGGILQILPDDRLAEVREQMSPAGQKQRDEIRKMLALTQAYLFLANCESRGNIFAHGPYIEGEDSETIVFREFSSLKSGPLSRYVDKDPPWPNLAVGLELRGVQVRVDEVCTFYTSPDDYTQGIRSFGLFTVRQGKIEAIDSHEIKDQIDFAQMSEASLTASISKLDRKSRIMAGALQYSSLSPYFEACGIMGHQPRLAPKSAQKYLPKMLKIDTHPIMARFSSRERLLSPIR